MWTVDARKKKKKMEKSGYFQQLEKYRYHIARLLYFGNSLRSIERGSGRFFNSIESFKDDFWRTFY